MLSVFLELKVLQTTLSSTYQVQTTSVEIVARFRRSEETHTRTEQVFFNNCRRIQQISVRICRRRSQQNKRKFWVITAILNLRSLSGDSQQWTKRVRRIRFKSFLNWWNVCKMRTTTYNPSNHGQLERLKWIIWTTLKLRLRQFHKPRSSTTKRFRQNLRNADLFLVLRFNACLRVQQYSWRRTLQRSLKTIH